MKSDSEILNSNVIRVFNIWVGVVHETDSFVTTELNHEMKTLLDTLLIIEKKEKLRQTWRTQKNGLEILKKTISIQVLGS